MQKQLTDYLITNNPQVEQFLKNIYLSDNDLQYQDIKVITNTNNPVTYIGEHNRQKARLNKMNELRHQIRENKEKESTVTSNIAKIKNKIKTLNELENNLRSKQNSLNSLENDLNQKEDALNIIKEKQANLNASNSPLLAQLQGYSYADCLKLKQQFEENQRLNIEQNNLVRQIEELNQEQTILLNKTEELKTKIEVTDQQITEKQIAIDDLQSDEEFQDLKDSEQGLISKMNDLEARRFDIIRQEGALSSQLTSKNNEYNELYSHQSDFQKALTQSQDIVQNIHIDEYTISEELQHIDTTEIQINSETKRLSLPEVPKSSFAKDLKQQLNILVTASIINENGVAQSILDAMTNLQKAIDSANQNATTLLENNEKSLRLIMFDQLKTVNKHVSKNIDAFVATMNHSNPSHLQFSAKSSISDQGQEILDILNDPTQYDVFFNQLLERIHRQLEKPDITPDDIINYMLAEIEPRRWYELSLFYKRDNNQEIEPLTTQAIKNSFSTGERARSYYIPMFALLEIVQSQMNPNAPHILIMDEAFNTIDEKQTKLLLEKIYDSCDLFIATTPGKTLPIVNNSKGSTTLQLQRVTINGVTTVQSFGGIMYEEIA
jgi:hypothetical protein